MTLSAKPYGQVIAHSSMSEPVQSWSMQSGGVIYLKQGNHVMRLTADDLAQLLIGHSNEHMVYEEVVDSNGVTDWLPVSYREPK